MRNNNFLCVHGIFKANLHKLCKIKEVYARTMKTTQKGYA